jgi:translocation and assembly module TamB
MTAEFRLDLSRSSYGAQPIAGGTLRGTLRSGRLDAAANVSIPEGQFAFDAALRPFDPALAVTLRNGRFSGVNLALLTDNPDLQTALAGTFELDFTGRDPALGVGSGRIVLAASTVNAARIESGLITFRLDRGFTTASAQLDMDEGEADLRLEGRLFDDVPTYALTGTLTDVDLVAFAGDRRGTSRTSLTVDARGRGTDPETMTAEIELRATDTRFPEAQIDTLEADLSLAGGILRADAFRLEADFASARGEGQIALFDTTAVTDFALTAEIREAGPLNAFFEDELVIESADLTARVTGPAGGPIAVDADAIVRQATLGRLGARRLDFRLNGEYDPRADIPFQGRARARFDYLALPTFSLRDGDVGVTYLDNQLAVEGSLTADDNRDIAFSAQIDAVEDALFGPGNAVQLADLNVRVGEERWELLQPSTIFVGDRRYRVQNFLLVSGDQQIAADGVVALEGEQTLVVTLDDVRLDPWVDLVGYEDVGGRLSGTLALSGTAAAPEIDGQLRIVDVTSRGEPVGALRVALAYAEGRMGVDATLAHVSGQDLHAEGFLPFAFRLDGEPSEVPADAPVELAITADAFPIEWAEPFLPPDMFRELAGTLTANILVGGTQSTPDLSGEARLVDGRLAMETTGDVVFQDVQVVLSLTRNVATLTEARASDGRGGQLTASGTITLPELSVGELDIALVMDNFRVIETQTYRGLTLTATPGQRLRFSGTLTDPVLTGGVTLASGDIFLTDELVGPDLEEVTLSEAEIQRVEATFGVRIAEADTARSAFVDNLRLDLAINVERNVWLRSRRNPRFDIEFSGEVDVQKPPGGENQLFGEIGVRRGRVQLPTLAGRAFSIGGVDDTYGRLVFNGPFEETTIDIRAGLEAPSGIGRASAATVFIGFQGRLADGPELTLSADPPMETADIACVMATGRPCGEAFQGGAVGDIALNQLGALVQGVAAEGLGLDVVEVTQRPTGEIVVTFGAYVTNRTFAAVSQPVTEGQPSATQQTTTMAPEVLIEYEALHWLLLRAERRNIGGVGGTLLFQFDY